MQLGIPVYKDEKYKEDFWILDGNKEKTVIAETKSRGKGFKKNFIFDIYNHRDANGLDENFPALLIVNAHLNANSWKDKIRQIDPQDYQVAVQHNVLITRIEDLLFFWNAIVEGKKTKEDLLTLFLQEKGWLEVKPDGEVKIHK
jgi:hypothetical protein